MTVLNFKPCKNTKLLNFSSFSQVQQNSMWGVSQLFSFIVPWPLLLSLGANIKHSDLVAASCYYLHFCSQRPPSFLFKSLLTDGITQAHRNNRSNYVVPFWVGLPLSPDRGFFFLQGISFVGFVPVESQDLSWSTAECSLLVVLYNSNELLAV